MGTSLLPRHARSAAGDMRSMGVVVDTECCPYRFDVLVAMQTVCAASRLFFSVFHDCCMCVTVRSCRCDSDVLC